MYLSFLTFNVTTSPSFLSLTAQNVMEQFNPGLRNLVNLGKSYEKSVTGELFYNSNNNKRNINSKSLEK